LTRWAVGMPQVVVRPCRSKAHQERGRPAIRGVRRWMITLVQRYRAETTRA
jgi:hypothetical protein